jgi:putative hemolysin
VERIDVGKILQSKSPALAKWIPRCVVNYLRRVIHERKLNEVLERYGDLRGVEFVRAVLGYLNITWNAVGMEKLSPQGRYLFASNHPFGGPDGLMLAEEVHGRFGDVRVVVNDLLMNIDPLRELFVPVNKHGRQSAGSVKALNEAFASDVPMITFPAGLCSRRMKGGEICDLEWKSNFVRKAAQSGRDIVPVYFEGRLSNRFYRLARLRKFLGIEANIEMLYLVDEMVRLRGRHYEIIIGDPIPHRELDKFNSPHEAAKYIREQVYKLRRFH